MKLIYRLAFERRGASAVEMALVAPLLLIILMGCLEVGNYFLDEHILVLSLRDGARFAGRQGFDKYANCPGPSTPSGAVEKDTRSVVKTGMISGGADRLANWNPSTITVSYVCSTDLAGGSANPTLGIYRGSAGGAPLVTVSATVPYTPILGSLGFSGRKYKLNGQQQAAVMGI